MKLHLPVALLAAVLSTFAYGEETATTQPYSYTYVEKDGTGYTTFTGNGYGVVIKDQTSGDTSAFTSYRNPASGKNAPTHLSMTGAIGGIAYNDSDKKADNVDITVKGNDTWLYLLAATGTTEYNIAGNKTVTVTDGAHVENIFGGSYERSVNASGQLGSVTEINVTNGATVGSISGGAFSSSNADKTKLATNEKVVINVENASVGVWKGGVSGTLTYTPSNDTAIIGGNSYNTSINAGVEINVSGDSVVYGQIYGGVYAGRQANASVQTTSVNINGGTIYGDVFGGGLHESGKDYYPSVLEGTKVAINGGTVTGNVYGAGSGDQIYGGTHVVVNGDATIHGDIYGGGIDGAEVKSGDRVITFDNHGEVDWSKVHDFDAVEFTGTTTTKLGTDGQLAENYKKVTINNSYITGSIRDGHEVELDVTNNIHVALDGNLTTKADSEIVNNENAIQIGGNATFNGTKIENSTINAGGNIAVNSGSTVTNGNLVAANGDVSFDNSSMNGGEITVGGKLSLLGSDVTAQVSTEGGAVLVESTLSDLTIDGSIKLADGSSFTGINYDQVLPGWLNKQSTLTADSIEIGKDLHSHYSTFTATEGGIVIGSGASLEYTHLNAKGDIEIEQATLYAGDTPEGYTPYGSSAVTSTDGDIIVGAGSSLTNTDLSAENGSVELEGSTMNGGNIVAGESLVLDGSTATVDSINGGNAVKLQMQSKVDFGSMTSFGSSLNVNSDVVLADGSTIWGMATDEYPFFGTIEGSTAKLEANSITTGEGKGSAAMPNIMYADLVATQGDISIGVNNWIANTDLTAAGDVILNSSNMKEGNIVAGNKVTLNGSEVSVNSISKNDDSAAVLESTNSKLTVTEGNLSLGSGSVVKDSALTATQGDVVLSGTTMTG
ncbi:MAG: hypothetical protein IKT79_11340, partial [Akkermansia sp.]|nr:hypothetical protein [Akkermansia sp.]